MNFGTCEVCPIGARYSPSYHLLQAVETGRCRILANTSVRRVVVDKSGRARALVYRPNDGATESEHAAKVIIIAAGAIESARLLLLSTRDRTADGPRLGPNVGHHLMFHHLWQGRLHYREAFRPGSVGPVTGQCHQFLDPSGRGKHGGIKIDLSSDDAALPQDDLIEQKTAAEVVEAYRQMRHWRVMFLQGETMPGATKYVTLSDQRDRFGDPFAHVHYESSDFDLETHGFARQLLQKFAAATGADDVQFVDVHRYNSGAHHAGTCRMGVDPRDSVVDTFGRVHGSPNLFAAGGSIMPSMGALQPTLTMAALAVRTARYLLAQGW